MKIPKHYRPDTPESIAPAVVPVYSKNQPSTRVRKGDVPRVTEKDPCDRCKGDNHPPLEALKYRPLIKQWLCRACRIETGDKVA